MFKYEKHRCEPSQGLTTAALDSPHSEERKMACLWLVLGLGLAGTQYELAAKQWFREKNISVDGVMASIWGRVGMPSTKRVGMSL